MLQNEYPNHVSAKVQSVGRNSVDRRYPIRVLLVLTAVALLIFYVETMVIPAVPIIQRDFSTTASVASWITSAFLIVGSASAPLFGKLGDIYGKKEMLLVSMSIYSLGVATAGLSSSIYFLLLTRAVQGVGFATFPLVIDIVTDAFPREKAAMAQGIISATYTLGAAVGYIVGSYVVQDLGWRYAFYSAFIPSLVLIGLVATLLRRDAPRTKSRVDYLGAFVLMSGVASLLFYITEGPYLGWLSLENLSFLLAGITLTAFFAVLERRSNSPLIQLGLLRIKNFLVANLIGISTGITMFLLYYAIVYYAELPPPFGLGLGVVSTALTLAPGTIVMVVMAVFVGKMVTKIGPKPVIIGSASVLILGIVLFIVNRSSAIAITMDVIPMLVGVISMIIPIVNMVSVSLPEESRTVGLGINTMLRNLGQAIGPVMVTTIMASYTSPLAKSIDGSSVVVGHLPSATGFNIASTLAILFAALIIAVSLSIKNYTYKKAS